MAGKTAREHITQLQANHGFKNEYFDKIEHLRSLIKNDEIYNKYWLGQTADERKALSTIQISRENPKSYFVYGATQDDLYKFLTYYCIMADRSYTEWDIQDFLDSLNTPAGAYLGIRNILVFYQHKYNIFFGAGEAYSMSKILRYITSRNRAGEPTLILSETMDNRFVGVGEVEIINLVELFKRTPVAENAINKALIEDYDSKKANRIISTTEVVSRPAEEQAITKQASDIMARKQARQQQAKKR